MADDYSGIFASANFSKSKAVWQLNDSISNSGDCKIDYVASLFEVFKSDEVIPMRLEGRYH